MERDTIKVLLISIKLTISTHTLTWSVTIFNFDCAFVILHFNSHAHVERDVISMAIIAVQNNFNSHAHVERDLSGILAHIFSRYFNSHAHVERDMIIWQHFRNMRISTHTLTWSVTNDTLYKYLPCFISTHTLTWSVTWSGKSCIAALFISTHTLTWSVTLVRFS